MALFRFQRFGADIGVAFIGPFAGIAAIGVGDEQRHSIRPIAAKVTAMTFPSPIPNPSKLSPAISSTTRQVICPVLVRVAVPSYCDLSLMLVPETLYLP